jgi:hypothetical protein
MPGRHLLVGALLTIGCGHRHDPSVDTRPVDDVADAPRGDAVTAHAEAPEPSLRGDEIDFSDEVALPTGTIEAQPERRPSGAFNICGGNCRYDTELAKSLEGVEDDEDEPPPRRKRRRRRRP